MAFCYRARTPGPGKTGLLTKCQGGIASLHPKEAQETRSFYLFAESGEDGGVTAGDRRLCPGAGGVKPHTPTGRFMSTQKHDGVFPGHQRHTETQLTLSC